MEKRKLYYFGFYRDYYSKEKPVPLICQVTDNVDCLSCELPGGIFLLLELSLSRQERDKVAKELTLQYGATYIEFGNRSRKLLSFPFFSQMNYIVIIQLIKI